MDCASLVEEVGVSRTARHTLRAARLQNVTAIAVNNNAKLAGSGTVVWKFKGLSNVRPKFARHSS
jgi:hypothetical protein